MIFHASLGRKIRTAKAYGPARLLGDTSGGLIAALIALPYGLAMASLMGLPPVLGIFTSILSAPILALLGRNPLLIGGTSSVTVPFLALAVKNHGIVGAAQVSILAACILILMGVTRLGRQISRVPHAVVAGFSCGIGAMMVISQLDIILGLASPIRAAPSFAAGQLFAVLHQVGDARAAPLILGLAVIVFTGLAARLSPRLPAPLIGVVVAVAIAHLWGFREKEIGSFAGAWPRLLVFSWKAGDVLGSLPAAFGLAFVSAVNILMTSRVIEHFRGRHKHAKPRDADGELAAYGVANCFAALFGAPPSVGIPVRSLAVIRCGGTTRLANLFHAVVLLLILWLGSGFVARVPIPALAGVTAWMGLRLLDWSVWRRLHRMSRSDIAGFLITACGVLVVNAVLAVVIGCLVYVFRAMYIALRDRSKREAFAVRSSEETRAELQPAGTE